MSQANWKHITLQDIYQARQRIAGIAHRTPLIDGGPLSEHTQAAVYLKLENTQPTGAFKLRGAANRLLSLSPEEKERGVITVSTGNHGRAVAYASQKLGIRAVIFLSENVPANKTDAIRRLGAKVVRLGRSYDEAMEHSLRLQQEQGLTYVEPFDDPYIIAGQGTTGLELLEDLPTLDLAIVPLSGGGLISGIALALKSANPAIQVVGVSMDRAPVMVHSLRAGRPIAMEELDTLADALVGGLGDQNRYTFPMVQALVDSTLLVSEEEIAGAMSYALETYHQVVEGGGAVGLAALLSGRLSIAGKKVVVVISGGNVPIDRLLPLTTRS